MSDIVEVHKSDLLKLLDTLDRATHHFHHRDAMNAALHLAPMRYSPLTSALDAARDCVRSLIVESPDDGDTS